MAYVQRTLPSDTLNGTFQSNFRLSVHLPSTQADVIRSHRKDMKQKHSATDHFDITNEDILHQNEEVQTFCVQQNKAARTETKRAEESLMEKIISVYPRTGLAKLSEGASSNCL